MFRRQSKEYVFLIRASPVNLDTQRTPQLLRLSQTAGIVKQPHNRTGPLLPGTSLYDKKRLFLEPEGIPDCRDRQIDRR